MVFQGTYENTIPKQNIKKNLNKTNELQKVIWLLLFLLAKLTEDTPLSKASPPTCFVCYISSIVISCMTHESIDVSVYEYRSRCLYITRSFIRIHIRVIHAEVRMYIIKSPRCGASRQLTRFETEPVSLDLHKHKARQKHHVPSYGRIHSDVRHVCCSLALRSISNIIC